MAFTEYKIRKPEALLSWILSNCGDEEIKLIEHSMLVIIGGVQLRRGVLNRDIHREITESALKGLQVPVSAP